MYNSDLEKIMRRHKRKLTRKNAIRIYCKECCCAGDQKSWKECNFTACPLFNFRLGIETLERGKPFTKTRKTIGSFDKNSEFEEGLK